MQSAEEFLKKYLHEIAAMKQAGIEKGMLLHQKYFRHEFQNKVDKWMAKKRGDDEKIENADVSQSSAIIVTAIFRVNHFEHNRYHLALNSEGHWQITNKEWECFSCKQSGQKENTNCKFCHGKGWVEFFRDLP